jgi:hypothetical protein
MINDDDAKRYGTALGNALRHLPIKTAQKTVDYTALVFVAFAIETPRIVRSAQLARQPKQPMRGPAQVFQFHSQPTPAPTTPSQTPTATGGPGASPSPPVAEGPIDLGGFGGDAPS